MDSNRTLGKRERDRMSGPWRVWEVCVMRSNNWGHAPFKAGELASLTGKNGQDTPANRDQVHRWLGVLTDMGRIDVTSTQLCVVINTSMAWRGAGKGSWENLCSEPKHSDTRKTPFNAPAPAFVPPAKTPGNWPGESDDSTIEGESATFDTGPTIKKAWRSTLSDV